MVGQLFFWIKVPVLQSHGGLAWVGVERVRSRIKRRSGPLIHWLGPSTMVGQPCICGGTSTPARHGVGRRGGRAHMYTMLTILDQVEGRVPWRLLAGKLLYSAGTRPYSATKEGG